MTAEFIIPRVPPSGNELRRKYRNRFAYMRLRGAWALEIQAAVLLSARNRLVLAAETGQRAKVEICVHHSRMYDLDNLHSGIKPVLDSLKNLGLISDDSPKHIELIVTQEQCPRKDQYTRFRISTIEGES